MSFAVLAFSKQLVSALELSLRGENLRDLVRDFLLGAFRQLRQIPLAIGLIGLGRLGRVYAANLANRIANTRLVAIAETQESLLRDVAAEFDVPRCYVDPLSLSSTTVPSKRS